MKKNAFTIIEMLLAVMLTVLVILSATSAFRAVDTAQAKTGEYDSTFSQLELFFDKISDDLANAYAVQGSEHGPLNVIPAGAGSTAHDRLTITRTIDPFASDSTATTADVEYGILNDDISTSGSIGRRLAFNSNKGEINSGGKLFILTEGVKAIRFEVYDGQNWSRNNTNTVLAPLMIKVHVELSEDLWFQHDKHFERQIPVYPFIYNAINNENSEEK